MFWKRKTKTIILSSVDFDADYDKLVITLKESACMSPNQVDELAQAFDNISNNDAIIIPDVIKEITVLKKYGKKK